jgi:hypothetical protein
MKVIHKNSKEVFDLSDIRYTKFYGLYGYLVLTINKEIYFMVNSEDKIDFCVMTDEFEFCSSF